MALPDSRMSAVVRVDAGVFHRRIEEALKTSPHISCETDTPLRPTRTDFVREDGQVRLRLELEPLTVFDNLYFYAFVNVTAERDDLTVSLGFELDRFEAPGSHYTEQQLEDMATEFGPQLDAAFADASPAIPLDELFADSHEGTGSARLAISDDAMDAGTTLAIGLRIEDDDTDAPFFSGEFTPQALGGSPAWSVEVAGHLVIERVRETLESIDFSQEVDNWEQTEEVYAYWSGQELGSPTYGQRGYIEEHYGEAPIWFIIEGDYIVFEGYGEVLGEVEVGGWAMGSAELEILEVEPDDPSTWQIVAIPRIHAAGWGIFRPGIDTDPTEPVEVSSAMFGDEGLFVATSIDFDSGRLRVNGDDLHPGLPGSPEIDVPDHVSVRFEWQQIGSSLCPGYVGLGSLNDAGHPFSRPLITNTGEAPLWLCNVEVSEGEEHFYVQRPLAPVRVDAGLGYRLEIAMSADDYDEHTGAVKIHSNDFDLPVATIPIVGKRDPRPDQEPSPARLCFRKPDLIPPQEWFERLADLTRRLDDLVQTPLTDRHDVEISIEGLAAAARLELVDGKGNALAGSVRVGRRHHLAIPIGESVRFELDTREKATLATALEIAEAKPVAEFTTREPVVALAADGCVAVMLTRLAVFALDLEGGPDQHPGAAELEGGDAVTVYDRRVYVRTPDAVVVLEASSPTQLDAVGRLERPEGVQTLRVDHRLVTLDGSRLLVDDLRSDGVRPSRHEIRLDEPADGLARWRGRWVVTGGESSTVLGAALRGIDPQRRIATEELPEAVRLQARSGAFDPGEALTRHRFRLLPNECAAGHRLSVRERSGIGLNRRRVSALLLDS